MVDWNITILDLFGQVNDWTQSLALFHQRESVVDGWQIECLSDVLVHHQTATGIGIDQFGYVVTTFPSTKRRTLPHSSGDQLKWSSADLLSRRSHACKQSKKHEFVMRMMDERNASLPIITDVPHPLWHASRADLIVFTLPMHSKV